MVIFSKAEKPLSLNDTIQIKVNVREDEDESFVDLPLNTLSTLLAAVHLFK